jgi:nucleotide-binding universal stress UspA family protein
VDQAAAIAAKNEARLVIATAHQDRSPDLSGPEPDLPSGDDYQATGNAPVYAVLREAATRARAAGATDVEERASVGAPVNVLLRLVKDVNADLLVVGNVGINSLAGRLLGSVPQTLSRRADVDVLVANTAK